MTSAISNTPPDPYSQYKRTDYKKDETISPLTTKDLSVWETIVAKLNALYSYIKGMLSGLHNFILRICNRNDLSPKGDKLEFKSMKEKRQYILNTIAHPKDEQGNIRLHSYPLAPKRLLQEIPIEITEIPTKLSCTTPRGLLQQIQRLLVAEPSVSDIHNVHNSIIGYANAILDHLATPDINKTIRSRLSHSPRSLDEFNKLLSGPITQENVYTISYALKPILSSITPPLTEIEKETTPIHDLYALALISDALADMRRAATMIQHMSRISHQLPESSPYRDKLFDNKIICKNVLLDTAISLRIFIRDAEKETSLAKLHSDIRTEQHRINSRLSYLISGSTNTASLQDDALTTMSKQDTNRLHKEQNELFHNLYPPSVVSIFIAMANVHTFDRRTDIKEAIKHACHDFALKHYDDSKALTTTQKKEMLHSFQNAFYRCSRDIRHMFVEIYREQALDDGIPQQQINTFLATGNPASDIFVFPSEFFTNHLATL